MKEQYFLIVLFLNLVSGGDGTDKFTEELFIRSLPTGQMYSHFQFTTVWNTTYSSEQSKHYRLFPRPLSEIFEKFSVKELHLSLSQNRWQHELWGYPIIDASKGAELLVWFSADVIDIDKQWLGLINVLSGMFCASLNFMDAKASITPRYNFRPKGVVSEQYEQYFSTHVRYASLPNENVCTENLTPWKKLLPCGFKAGLSAMLNAIKLYDTSYHSISVHFRHICMDESCSSMGLELSQGLGVVFDPSINLRVDQPDWSFKRYFGRMIANTCPLAASSQVYVDLSHHKEHTILSPPPSYYAQKDHDSTDYAVYDLIDILSKQNIFNLDVKYSKPVNTLMPPESALVVGNRFQTGSGQGAGGVVCLIYNKHSTDLFTTYLEILPHFLRVYLHTLKLESFAGDSADVEGIGTPITPHQLHYIPGKDNGRPYQLELAFTLPKNSLLRISFQFERHLQKWLDYPPDANHGFYIAPSIISVTLPSPTNVSTLHHHQSYLSTIFHHSNSPFFVRIHTEALLISLPTPDFSMPYNVICLVCTVIAVAFGSVHNITTKSFVLYDPLKRKNFLARFKEKIMKKISENGRLVKICQKIGLFKKVEEKDKVL